VAEPDQLLYLQYARSMAQGMPYVFSPGDAPSSGSTTHLYILLLSWIYRLGAQGEAFFYASFLLNALIYLGVTAMIWLIARRMAPQALLPVMLLTVLGGHTVSAILKQTDIGFFMLLALALFAALIHGRYRTALILAMLCAATRPEGFVFAFAFLLCGGAGLVLNRYSPYAPGTRRQAAWFLAYGLAGALVFILTLCINYRYTGYFQFMSVAHKGYFKAYPFFGALEHSLYDLLQLIKGVFFGLHDTYRQFYLFPLLAGTLGLSGILLHRRDSKETRLNECWLALSAGAAILLVASSQWQGISNDRYLGWIMPLWILYIAIGITEIARRLRVRHFAVLCICLLGLYQAVSLAYVAGSTYSAAVRMEYMRNFGARIGETFNTSVRFGSTAGGGINYSMPGHKVYNLWGVTAPDFFVSQDGMQLQRLVDHLKHHPELRFDYWISTEHFLEEAPWLKPLVGSMVLQDTDTAIISDKAYGVYEPRWETFEGGGLPVTLGDATAALTLVDALDVGYIPHETGHDYATALRLKNARVPLIASTAALGSETYSETGRIVLGSESFTVHSARPGSPLLVVLRTGRQTGGDLIFGRQHMAINRLELNEKLKLRLFVDEREVPCPEADISGDGFREIAFRIPAEYIQSDRPRLTVVGDHVSFAYWFYQ
jgi:hypothetical protein